MADDEQNGGRQRPPCAACNHRQRSCPADCVFAPYFAAHRARDFEAVRNVFGINKASKMLKNQDNEQRRGMAAEAMIWDALEWERNPVLGPQGVFQRLTDEKQALVSQRQERTQEMGLLMKQVEWQKEEIAFLETQLLDMQRSSHQIQMMMMLPGINQTASGHYGAPAYHQTVPFPPPETQIHVPNQRYGNNNNRRAVQDAGDPTHHTNNGNWAGQDQREGHVMAQNHQPHHHSGQIPTEQQYYRESNGRSFDQSMMPRSLRFNNAQAIMPISNNGEGRENFNGGAGRNWEHRGNHGGSYSIPLQGGGGGGNGGVQRLGNGSNGLGPSHQTGMGNAHGGAGPRENFNGGAGRNWEHRGNHGGSLPLQGGGGGGGGNGGVQGLGNGNGLGPSHQTGMGNAHAGGELGAVLRAHWPDNGRL